MIPQTISVPELAVIATLILFFAMWGWRHGLDAIILAGLLVIIGRVSVDTLAVPVSNMVNTFAGLFEILSSGQFSREALLAVVFGGPGAPPPLINVKDPNDAVLRGIGTGLFILIAIIGFRFAVQKAGGKDTPIEQVFGFVGGGVLGYLCVTFVIDRHFTFPTSVKVEPSTVPQLSVDASLIVAIVMVLIVFGIQRAKPPAKKK